MRSLFYVIWLLISVIGLLITFQLIDLKAFLSYFKTKKLVDDPDDDSIVVFDPTKQDPFFSDSTAYDRKYLDELLIRVKRVVSDFIQNHELMLFGFSDVKDFRIYSISQSRNLNGTTNAYDVSNPSERSRYVATGAFVSELATIYALISLELRSYIDLKTKNLSIASKIDFYLKVDEQLDFLTNLASAKPPRTTLAPYKMYAFRVIDVICSNPVAFAERYYPELLPSRVSNCRKPIQASRKWSFPSSTAALPLFARRADDDELELSVLGTIFTAVPDDTVFFFEKLS